MRPDQLLSVDQAVRKYQTSRRTLFRLLERGELERFHIHGDRRTLLEDEALGRLLRPTTRASRLYRDI